MKRVVPVRLFVSYSHLDKEWFGKLRPLLKFKTPMQTVHVWHRDGTIRSSEEGRVMRLERRGRVIQSLDNRSTAQAGGTHD